MKPLKNYTTFQREKTIFAIAIAAVILVILIATAVTFCRGESLATCYVMCKPGSRVSVRWSPSKSAPESGYAECGDSFHTDGESYDGWIRCYDIGEGGWIYSGYVSTQKPEKVGERYVCVANRQAACRKWMGGPQIEEKPWIKNGQFCQVFVTDGEWAVTNRGYIKMDYLEASPE